MCAVRAPGSGGARIAMNYLRHRLPSHGLLGSTHTRGRRSLDRIYETHDVPSPRNYVRHESAGTLGGQAGYPTDNQEKEELAMSYAALPAFLLGVLMQFLASKCVAPRTSILCSASV